MIKRHPQEFQVLKYVKTMSSHGLSVSIESICKRFVFDERLVKKYINFLISMGEIVEQEENNKIIFVTEKWFLRKK
jgi:predicted transcriptional regulator